MVDVQIFWDPDGFTLDSLGSNKLLGLSDADTTSISVTIRMLSIDAPEVHYPGNTKPSNHDADLAQLAQWLVEGRAPVHPDLAEYLHGRLVNGQAGTLQLQQGQQATDALQQMVDQLLTRPNGTRRNVFVHTADEQFDQYGRLLAYVAPYYSSAELDSMSLWERATFNMLLVRSGWVAPFIIYPSIPKYGDLIMFRASAREAYLAGRGVWAEPLTLTGYEFRMAVKLYGVTKRLVMGEKLSSRVRDGWISRYCVDLTTRQIYYPQHYFRIAPYNRLFIWPKDVSDAVGRLNLLPAQESGEGG